MPDTSDKENEAVVPSKYRKLDDRPTDKEDKKRKRRSLKKVILDILFCSYGSCATMLSFCIGTRG
jgi:hypothetical protein